MKKIFILILLISFPKIFSQETEQQQVVTKSGKEILPKAGDIALGVDALPYLNYLGNIFNNTTNNTLALGSNTLYFKYYLSDNSAVRICLNINSNKIINKYYVQDDAARMADPLSRAVLIDKKVTSNNGYGIALGYLMSRGYDRVRGFYGIQAGYNYNRGTLEYQYGNSMTPENPTPSTAWGRQATRILEKDNGIVQTIGGGIVVGVEYYFLPKICIGGEVTLQYQYSWGSQSNQKTETIVGNDLIQIDDELSPGDKSSSLNTFRPATFGGLYLMFHF